MNKYSHPHIILNLDTLFYFCFILWYSTEIIFRTNISVDATLEKGISYFVLGLLIIQDFAYQEYEIRELIIIVAGSVLITVSAILCGENSILSAWLFIISFKNCSFKKTVNYAYRILSIVIPAVIILSFVNIIPDVVTYRGDIERHSLGFMHPNQLGLVVFQWILCRVYLFWEKLKLIDILLLGILGFAIKRVTDSYTATASIIILSLLVGVVKLLEYYQKHFSALLVNVFSFTSLCLMILSVVLTYIDVNRYEILKLLDILLSRRFTHGHRVYSIYGSSLLGQRVYVTAADLSNHREIKSNFSRLFLDSAYATLWLRYGLVVLILFIVSYFILYRKVAMPPSLLIILFVYSVYGIMEHSLFQLRHNIFLLLFSFLVFPEKDEEFLRSLIYDYEDNTS